MAMMSQKHSLNKTTQSVSKALTGYTLLDLTNPPIDWVSISSGMGVPAVRAETPQAFREALQDALHTKGPRLIEAVI